MDSSFRSIVMGIAEHGVGVGEKDKDKRHCRHFKYVLRANGEQGRWLSQFYRNEKKNTIW